MRMHRAQYEVTCQLLLCLIQSDHIIVNATSRIIDKSRIEHWIVGNMQHLCRECETGGHWSHFYSQSIRHDICRGELPCRTCAYSCVLAYHLCIHPERGEQVQGKLLLAGLTQFLQGPPIENIAHATHIMPIGGSQRQHIKAGSVASQEEEDAPAAEYLFSYSTMESSEDEPLLPHRSIEYTGNLPVIPFDNTVYQLFDMFHINYGPSTAAQRELVNTYGTPV
jgi:hypothetical protein